MSSRRPQRNWISGRAPMKVTRAVVFGLGMLGLLGFFALDGGDQSFAANANGTELKLPEDARVERFDFDQEGIEGWKTVNGQWTVEEMAEAPSGKRVLILRPQGSDFNVIVAPGGPYSDVDVSVRFKPISGREDASGGIVFRFSEGKYYVARANALENNFNFYYYDPNSFLASVIGGRHLITGGNVTAPALGQWHKLRVIAEGDHI